MPFTCTIPARPTVLFDDAAARVTRWDFEPGACTGWHRHGMPYFVTLLTDAVLRIDDGAKTADVPLKAGDTYRRLEGVEHDVMNASPHPIAFVETEIRDADALTRA